MSKDPSIPRRNKINWHYVRDDSKVARTEAQQLKIVLRRSKQQTHISQLGGSGTDEGTSTIPGVPDVPPYESKSNKESWGDSANDDNNDDDGESDDRDDDYDDERTKSDSDEILDLNLTNLDDEETIDDEEDDDVIKDLYDNVNVNLGNDDTEMTNDNQGGSKQQNVSQESGFEQEEEDTHVTLTPVPDPQKMKEAVNVSVQLQTNKLREEAQAENQEFLNQDEMIKTRMKTPLLDQTEGRKEGNLVKMLSPSKIQGLRKRSLQAPPKMLLNLNISLLTDLEYLKGGDSSRRYSTYVTKTKAATYELKWIEDLVLELWSPVVVKYDQHAYFSTAY
nr:hypothetical protein [Tanacetum cinerariifolium]